MQTTVAILLTTWNGSRYLPDLLHSLQAQTYRDWTLYVRDDGSTDDTLALLDSYAQKDGRIHVVKSEGNLGPKDAFLWLLANVDAPLYMFCDHDDVWLPEKVERSVKLMQAQPDWQRTPLVVGTDLRVVDAHLQTMAESFWALHHFSVSLCNDKYFHLVYNNIPGCTMLFNRSARQLALPCPETAKMHDSWLLVCVLWKGGRVLPLDEATILYRQHGHNVLGSRKVPSLVSQAGRFRTLWQKTRTEWQTVKDVAHVGFLHFFLIKMYYMMRLHVHA